ncbi:hypothetical protein B7O87_09385 [Cylindrospermopsis raciborskii CENA303]|uniref:Uncharacterized protein n=1 Tax=Cylindrospermopsis raciborskii CENA303 TaxID=1170769 RepID=A0A1X4G6Q5_9CYAN|nr:hypothetical protein [Cylindrospermopsis raciborskii]OSO90561.1 hypothetical protein B7O87_09385 [Cylindrospermopsis raciborskii CENA303]
MPKRINNAGPLYLLYDHDLRIGLLTGCKSVNWQLGRSSLVGNLLPGNPCYIIAKSLIGKFIKFFVETPLQN